MAQARPWINNFQVRLHRMIDLLEARFPGGCKIFLADVYDPTDGIGDAQNAGLPKWPDGLQIHRAYNDVIHRCAAQRRCVVLVSLYEEFLGHGIHCVQPWREHYRDDDPHYWYASNLEDPSCLGFARDGRGTADRDADFADRRPHATMWSGNRILRRDHPGLLALRARMLDHGKGCLSR